MWRIIYKSLYGRSMRDPRRPWEANFIRAMAQRRIAQGMTQTELARRLRESYDLPFHQQTIQRMESGDRPIRLDEAHLISGTLGSSLAVMTADLGGSVEEVQRYVETLYGELDTAGVELAEAVEYQLGSVEMLYFELLKAWERYSEMQEELGKEVDADTSAMVRRAESRYERFQRGVTWLRELGDL